MSVVSKHAPVHWRRSVSPLLLAGLIVFLACTPSEGRFEAVVLKVYDGDTVLVSRSGGTVLVRLAGIDAPERAKKPTESAQPFSRKAWNYLSERVKGQQVVVLEWGTDRYGRRLGEILLKGTNINIEMVRTGLAEVYRGRTPDGFDTAPYRSAETKARKAAIGVWSLGDRYVSPVDWKHRRH